MGFTPTFASGTGQNEPPPTDRRPVIDAILYIVKGGIPWRLLPAGFPPWKTVHSIFRRWTLDHTRESLNDCLWALARQAAGQGSRPTAAILDSQSVKSDAHGGTVGYDAAKKIQGRKPHLLVDTLDLVLGVLVTAVSVPEREGAQGLLARVLGWFTWLPADVRRWRLQWPGVCILGADHPAEAGGGGGQAIRRCSRIQSVAPALGGRAHVWMADSSPAIGA